MGFSPSLEASPAPHPKQVVVCQNKSCKRSHSEAVLAAFRSYELPDWEIVASSCLGQCGNGPMVLILPERIWYGRVHPDEVQAIVERHLRGGVPIEGMMYRKLHPAP